MTTISQENKKQFRRPMEVYAGLNGVDKRTTITVTPAKDSSGNYIAPPALYDTADSNQRMITLADFSGGGIDFSGGDYYYLARPNVIDGHYDDSDDQTKIGYQSHVGNGQQMILSWQTKSGISISGLTLSFTPESTGTVAVGDNSYTIATRTVIPVEGKSGTLTINNASDTERVILKTCEPGVSLAFTSDKIVKVSLNLRSDLSVDSQTIPISEIELQVYYNEDISNVISNVADGAAIYYYAGYDGDYSEERYFYLSEAATMENGLITIKGEDTVQFFDDNKITAQTITTKTTSGKRDCYNLMKKYIKEALPTGASLQYQKDPSGTNTGSNLTVILPETNTRELISEISHIGQCPSAGFYPRFIDAGIPTLLHTAPAFRWDIYESETGDLTREVDRKITAIKSDSADYNLGNSTNAKTAWVTLDEKKTATAGTIQTIQPSEGQYWIYTVSNGSIISKTPDKLVYKVIKTAGKKTNYYYRKKKGGKLYACSYATYKKKKSNMRKKVQVYVNTCIAKGKKVDVTGGKQQLNEATKRPGYTLEVNPLEVKGYYKDGSYILYPRHERRFELSNIGGTFTWKGNPKMQPGDVIYFYHDKNTGQNDTGKDYEVIRAEEIELTHESGGTQAKITYRKWEG